MLPTLAINMYVTGLLTVLFLFVCVVLILTVLIQRPAGGGLSGAFGSGAGSGQTAFGAKTGDALTIATIIMFAVYLATAVALNFAARPEIPSAITPAAAGTGTEAPVAPTGIPSGDVPGTAETAGEVADEDAGGAPAEQPDAAAGDAPAADAPAETPPEAPAPADETPAPPAEEPPAAEPEAAPGAPEDGGR